MSFRNRQWNQSEGKRMDFRGPHQYTGKFPYSGRGSSTHVPGNPQMGTHWHSQPPNFSNASELVFTRCDFDLSVPPQFSRFQSPTPPLSSASVNSNNLFSSPPPNLSGQNQQVHPPHLRASGGTGQGFNLPTNYMFPPPQFHSNSESQPPQFHHMPGNFPGSHNLPPPGFPPNYHQESAAGDYQVVQFNKNMGNFENKEFDDRVTGSQLLDTWLHKQGKVKSQQWKPIPITKPSFQLYRSINELKEMMRLLESMTSHVEKLTTSSSSMSNASWDEELSNWEAMKERYISLEQNLDETAIGCIKQKLNRVRQKRARLKRARQRTFEENQRQQEAWQETSHQIDTWQERHQEKIRVENLRKMRKAAADKTLAKVTREIQDATRLIETMLALQKLRLIRRDAAQKRGESDLGESRQAFEQRIADMTRLVQAQLECYKEEEAKLKEVIKSEQEENTKQEKLVQIEKEVQKQREEDEDLQKILFGLQDVVSPKDPLFPFVQYYRQAENSLQSFLQTRHEWDAFSVPENTPAASKIPSSWVVPDLPSNVTWASSLK